MGIPEIEAKKYEGQVKSGSSLISVHSDDSDETKHPKEIFKQGGEGYHNRRRAAVSADNRT